MYDLANILNENGITTDVLCSNVTSETKIENVNNYKVVKAGSLGVVASTSISPSLIKCFKEISHDYDIVHIHHPNPTANIALMFSGFKGKVVLHWHSDIIRQKFLLKFYKPFLLWMLRRSDKIIATSPPYAEHSNFLKDFKKKIEIIPFGLNTDKMKDINKDLVIKIKERYSDKKIIFSLGRLIYYKGFEYLIESARYLPDNFVVLIGGIGNLKEKLKLLIKNNKLTEKVFLLESITYEEKLSYFEVCDLFVLPSIERSEAFGIVQIEAMYFKKPIVSTNIIGSGVSWVNQNGISGCVVEPKNPSKLAEAIIKILSNKSIYNNFSVNAYKRFIDNFHIDMTLKRMVRVYNELMQ